MANHGNASIHASKSNLLLQPNLNKINHHKASMGYDFGKESQNG